MLQNHFIGNKASEINKNLFCYIIEIKSAFFFFICLLKILNRKAIVLKETLGFGVLMAMISSYNKHVPEQELPCRLLTSTSLFVAYK